MSIELPKDAEGREIPLDTWEKLEEDLGRGAAWCRSRCAISRNLLRT